MSEEIITLYTPGALPGIPGEHGPGRYLVDYEARTIRPAQEKTSEETPAHEVPPTEQPTPPTPDTAMPEVVPVPDLPQETIPAIPEGNGVQVGG